jgi:hypothetical protein
MTATMGCVLVTYLSLQKAKIYRAGYFWSLIFKDCIEVVKKCHPCQVFARKMHSHLAPLHPFITIGPFTKWGVDFLWECVNCVPPSHLHELDFMIGNGIVSTLTHVPFVLDLSLFWFMLKHRGRYFDTMLGWFY